MNLTDKKRYLQEHREYQEHHSGQWVQSHPGQERTSQSNNQNNKWTWMNVNTHTHTVHLFIIGELGPCSFRLNLNILPFHNPKV